MLDIFRGFVRNYFSFRLEYSNQEFTDTKYTNVILNYFLRMGEYLGFDGIMEDDNRDLTWKRPGTTKRIMHLEHENCSNLRKVLNKEFEQLKQSEASTVIGIFYPENKQVVNLWIDAFMDAKTWRKTVLFILNPFLEEDDETNSFHALISEDNEFKHYVAKIAYLDEPIELLIE